jgi:ectoine hydroxylase-related dioxygenase (phytanoyl-CoA dioxygenase family)
MWSKQLARDGYCIIPAAISCRTIAALAADLAPTFDLTPRSVGPFYGERTKRFGSLLTRSRHAASVVQHPLILEIVRGQLGPWCDDFQLNLTQAIEIQPGAAAQPPHRDQDMWRGGREEVEYLVNVMWPFTRYTKDNGATMLWPGSHRRQSDPLLPLEEAIAAEMEPGSALLFLGSTLHAGGANRTTSSRRGMIVSYSLGWLKPYELQWLVYPPHVARHFSPELAALVGYRIHRPNLGNVEGQCPSILLKENGSRARGAVDALGPEQKALIASYQAQFE